MNPTLKSSFLNLGAITRETGVNADTLRAWERRYNLPQPARSEGGQRLYSQEDLEIIKWLVSQQKTGMRISKIVELWHSQVEKGINPLLETKLFEKTSATSNSLTTYRQRWFSACVAFDEAKAGEIINEAFSQYQPEDVCFDVLLAGLSEIGAAWYKGDVSVQQEHFASALVVRRLNALIAGAPPPIRTEKIIVAAPPDEAHTISSLLLSYLLRRRGWDVIYLGANVPLENFRSTLESIQPELVVLTAQQIFTAASLLDFAKAISNLPAKLAFGGLVFNRIPQLTQEAPGYFLGKDLKLATSNIERLIFAPQQAEWSLHFASPLLEKFRSMLPSIENHVYEASNIYPELQIPTSQYLSRDILAALKLGNINFLDNDMDWLRGLLINAKVPNQVLIRFLQIYHQAVDLALGEKAASILNWLQSIIEKVQKDEPK